MCIQVLGASNRKCAHIGDVIITIIKEAVPNMPLEKSEVVRAVVIRTCKEFEHDNKMMIRSDDNAIVVIDQEGNPKGTRVFGLVSHEIETIEFHENSFIGSQSIISTDRSCRNILLIVHQMIHGSIHCTSGIFLKEDRTCLLYRDQEFLRIHSSWVTILLQI
jgi:large subunit ribosomal protein L14